MQRAQVHLLLRMVVDHPDLALDVAHHALGFLGVAVREQPARAIGQVPPHQQDRDAQHTAQAEGDAPADVGRQESGLEQDDAEPGAEGRTHPERAVDDEIHPAAHARGDERVDGGVDRGVLPADTEAGEEAAERERRDVPGERGEHRGDEVHEQRDEEHALAPRAGRRAGRRRPRRAPRRRYRRTPPSRSRWPRGRGCRGVAGSGRASPPR